MLLVLLNAPVKESIVGIVVFSSHIDSQLTLIDSLLLLPLKLKPYKASQPLLLDFFKRYG